MFLKFLQHRLQETTGGTGEGGTGAPAPAAPAPAAAPAAGGATPWYGGFEPDLRGYIETKGFPSDDKGLAALAGSYRNLEKHFGVPAEQLLKLPKDDADKETWNKIYDRLGRPAKPEEYELPIPAGVDDGYAKFIATTMHELGITKKQAQALAAKQNEFVAGEATRQAEAYSATIEQQDSALHSKWGEAYDKNIQIARGSFAELGLKPEAVDALEKVMGFAGVMEFFHNIGSKIGEDKFVSPGGVAGFAGKMSPAAAQSRLDAIRNDPVLSAKYVNGDAALRAEMDNLHGILARSGSRA